MPLICLVGADGTGKTSQADLLVDRLEEKGIDAVYRWFRFNHMLSLPALSLARLLGLSSGRQHTFWKAPPFALLYVMLQWLDTLLGLLLRFGGRRRTVVCDRFVPDTIADLRLSTRFSLVCLTKAFRPLLGDDSRIVLLNAPSSSIRSRRSDLARDSLLEAKVATYRELASSLGLPVVDASKPIMDVHRQILKVVRA